MIANFDKKDNKNNKDSNNKDNENKPNKEDEEDMEEDVEEMRQQAEKELMDKQRQKSMLQRTPPSKPGLQRGGAGLDHYYEKWEKAKTIQNKQVEEVAPLGRSRTYSAGAVLATEEERGTKKRGREGDSTPEKTDPKKKMIEKNDLDRRIEEMIKCSSYLEGVVTQNTKVEIKKGIEKLKSAAKKMVEARRVEKEEINKIDTTEESEKHEGENPIEEATKKRIEKIEGENKVLREKCEAMNVALERTMDKMDKMDNLKEEIKKERERKAGGAEAATKIRGKMVAGGGYREFMELAETVWQEEAYQNTSIKAGDLMEKAEEEVTVI